MKLQFILIVFLALIPEILTGQSKTLTSKAKMQQVVKFSVNGKLASPEGRSASPDAFKLKPEEKKAVALVEAKVRKVERDSVPIFTGVTPGKKISILPELYYAKVSGSENQVSYRILFVDSAPLRYDLTENIFAGGIRFLAVESGYTPQSSPAEIALQEPEHLYVSYGSNSIPIEINSINWPPHDLAITAPDPVDSLTVKILTITNPAGYLKTLPVEPVILLSSIRKVIQGLGIQSIPVTAALKGVTIYKPVPIVIQTSLGKIDTSNITLTNDRPKEVYLKSESLGTIRLGVVNPNYISNTIAIEAVFPLIFFLCSILGGLLGSLANKLNAKEKITAGTIILGCILGLIASVAWWGLGVKLLGISPETHIINEAMVFGTGLLAGYFGISLANQGSKADAG